MNVVYFALGIIELTCRIFYKKFIEMTINLIRKVKICIICL